MRGRGNWRSTGLGRSIENRQKAGQNVVLVIYDQDRDLAIQPRFDYITLQRKTLDCLGSGWQSLLDPDRSSGILVDISKSARHEWQIVAVPLARESEFVEPSGAWAGTGGQREFYKVHLCLEQKGYFVPFDRGEVVSQFLLTDQFPLRVTP